MPDVTTDAHVRPLPPGLRDARHLVGEYRIGLSQLLGPPARCARSGILDPCGTEHPDKRLYKLLAPFLKELLDLGAGDAISTHATSSPRRARCTTRSMTPRRTRAVTS